MTLARGLRREQFPAALAALAALGDGDLVAAGTALRRWDGTTRREWLVAPGPPRSGTAGTAPDG